MTNSLTATVVVGGHMNNSILSRTAVFIYGVTAYAVGMGGLTWLILALPGLAPIGFGPVEIGSTAGAVIFNLLLIVFFGVKHSVMARPAFKEKWTKIIPEAAERSTYVLATGLAWALIFWLWQPLPAVVWSVETPALQYVLWALFAFGWILLVVSSFAIDHFDLFGLRQVYLYFRNRPYTQVPYARKWMYRYVRHPLMTGVLIGVWVTPHMTLGHLLIAIALTGYILIGVKYEEQDLIRTFGDDYRRYRAEVGAFFPRSPRTWP